MTLVRGLADKLRALPGLQERMAEWVVREYGSLESVPTAVLLQHLQHELSVRLAFVQALRYVRTCCLHLCEL